MQRELDQYRLPEINYKTASRVKGQETRCEYSFSAEMVIYLYLLKRGGEDLIKRSQRAVLSPGTE
jgi:hypothetical protein